MPLNNYDDFVRILLQAGFSMATGNIDGVYAVVPFGWSKEPRDSKIRWHTGDPETDPWEWRLRVLEERDDIAYGKLFFRKGGYITEEWYPYFLAIRRGGMDFAQAYQRGGVSSEAKIIYEIISARGEAAFDEIKRLGAFSREDKSRFEAALTELQMKLYITICDIRQRISADGRGYGWPVTVFCTTEAFWGEEVFDKGESIRPAEAEEAVAERILALNPGADRKKMIKFMRG